MTIAKPQTKRLRTFRLRTLLVIAIAALRQAIAVEMDAVLVKPVVKGRVGDEWEMG